MPRTFGNARRTIEQARCVDIRDLRKGGVCRQIGKALADRAQQDVSEGHSADALG